MKILILGGTVFLGRALVEAAMLRGHELTLFNRGRSGPDLYPEIERLKGNRDGGLSVLAGRSWDAAIDTSGYVPRLVRDSAEMLREAVGHYTFISSLSVYSDFKQPGMDESGPLGKLNDESIETVDGETYGPLKALCEQAAESAMPRRVLVIRPGLIVGQYDPSDRFTYWPERVRRGGEVLAPGKPGRMVQYIDVRDLAEWNIRMVETGKTGVYNANGPEEPQAMQALLEACKTASGSEARFNWVSEKFLEEQGVEGWSEMPLWLPESDPEYGGFFSVNVSKAQSDGLTYRSAVDTAQATLEWSVTRPADHAWRAGITAEREAALLELWKQRLN
jgi:2'-hydroxyisoflavone reductase